jgi:photosystem II stability/assembly factor-like uncharacterized protein
MWSSNAQQRKSIFLQMKWQASQIFDCLTWRIKSLICIIIIISNCQSIGQRVWESEKFDFGNVTLNESIYLKQKEVLGSTWSRLTADGGTVFGLGVNANGYLYAGTFTTLFRSTDGGETWEEKSAGLPTASVINVTVDSSDNVFIDVFAHGIYNSTDNGESWQPTTSFPLVTPPFIYSIPCASGLSAGVVVSSDNEYFYACTSGEIFASQDTGRTWELRYEHIPTNFTVKNLVIDNADILFVCTVGDGVWRSIDRGYNWQEINNGLGGYQTRVILAIDDQNIFSAADGAGIFKSTDGGDSWNRMNSGIQFPSILSIVYHKNADVLIAGGSEGRIYRSADRGETWSQITSGLPMLGFFESLFYHDTTQIVYGAVSSRGVFRSVDSGISWEQINCGLTDTIAMSLSRNWANNLMTAIRDQEVFQLNGTCWTALASGLTPLTGSYISMIYDSLNRTSYVSNIDGVFRLQNENSVWDQTNLSSPLIKSISVNEGGDVYAGIGIYNVSRFNDLFVSIDQGDTWNSIRNDFPTDDPPTALFASGNLLYVGTWASGIFRTNIPTNIQYNKDKIPDGFYLEQNYPNPFNPSTTVEFHIASPGFVSLKIFDVLGNEVETLVNEEKEPGSYKIEYNASHLASGIYYYKLNTNGFTDTKKFMLIK